MKTIPQSPLEAWIKAKIGLPVSSELTRRSLAEYQLDKIRGDLAPNP